MKKAWITLAAGLLIVMIGIPTVAAAVTRASQTSANTDAIAPAPAVIAATTPCDEQTALVNAAKNAINDKWGVAADRAKQLGATDADIEAAKTILLSSDPPEKRSAELVTLYQNSSLKNLSVTDLQKVYDVVDARTAYEKALAVAADVCPSLFGPTSSAKTEPPASDPMAGADAKPSVQAAPPAPNPDQVKVIPPKAPETGDGSLAP